MGRRFPLCAWLHFGQSFLRLRSPAGQALADDLWLISCNPLPEYKMPTIMARASPLTNFPSNTLRYHHSRFPPMVNLTRSEDSTLADPLSRALKPPANETPEEHSMREAKEAEARWVSERIDEQIKSEKQAKTRNKAQVGVLLLGQAESGTLPSLALPLV